MAKFDNVLCYCHGHIHRLQFKDKRRIDRHADRVTHNLRVQSSLHWHGVWTYSSGMASAFTLLWTLFCLRNGKGIADTANRAVIMPHLKFLSCILAFITSNNEIEILELVY